MNVPEFKLTLITAPDEPAPENLEQLQKELESLGQSRTAIAVDVVGTSVGAMIGTVLLPIPLLGAAIGTAAGAWLGTFTQMMATFGPALGTALGAWLHSRVGRKVRIKVGPDGFEAEAQTTEELAKLLLRVEEFQKRYQPRIIQEP